MCLCGGSQTLDDEPALPGKEYQWQNRPVTEWTTTQVCHWLMGMNMDQYIEEFTAKGVDGQQLLYLDSDRLKVGFCPPIGLLYSALLLIVIVVASREIVLIHGV